MAVNENENNKGTGNAGAAFNAAGIGTEGRSSERAAPSQARRTTADLAGGPQTVNQRFMRSVPRAQTSQIVTEARKVLEKSLSEYQIDVNNGVTYKIDSIDQTLAGVKMAAVLTLAYFKSDEGKDTMLFYTTLLEASVPSLGFKDVTPKVNASFNRDNEPRRSIMAPQTAYDFATPGFVAAIENKLRQSYGEGYDLIPVGGMTIPRSIDLTKDENRVHEILVNVVGALDTYIARQFGGEAPLTIRDVTENSTVSIIMDHHTVPGINAIGLPVRQDVTLTLRSTQRSANAGEPDESKEVVQASGYIDLIFTEPPVNNTLNARPETRCLTPFFLLTGLTSVDFNLITPETQLLALGLTPVMAHGEQYLAPLMNRATQGNPDHDAGALGFLVNYSGDPSGQPIGFEDTSKMSTKEQLDMLRAAIFPELHVAIIIDKSGPLSWMNSLFVDAANGDTRAEDAVIEAANNLTGGVFGDKWRDKYGDNGGPELFRILRGGKHLGYYTNAAGEVRDLNDADTLWAFNTFGERNIERAWEYIETYLQDGDEIVQMAQRWKIITDRYPNATLVSTGVMVEATPELMEVLFDSLSVAGLTMRAATVLQDFSGARNRASFQGGRGLDAATVGTSLNRNYGGTGERGRGLDNSMGLNSWRNRRG